jgi:hypothetical protein
VYTRLFHNSSWHIPVRAPTFPSTDSSDKELISSDGIAKKKCIICWNKKEERSISHDHDSCMIPDRTWRTKSTAHAILIHLSRRLEGGQSPWEDESSLGLHSPNHTLLPQAQAREKSGPWMHVNPSGRSKSNRNPIDGHNLNELILCFVGDFSTVFYKWATALELLIVYFFISGQQWLWYNFLPVPAVLFNCKQCDPQTLITTV